jgi:hypothetical protein
MFPSSTISHIFCLDVLDHCDIQKYLVHLIPSLGLLFRSSMAKHTAEVPLLRK